MPDLVPTELRRYWVHNGWCPDKDLYTLFTDHVRTHPERAALIDASGTVTYDELGRSVARVAAGLTASGARPRDIIAIQIPNGREAVIAEIAVAAIAAVALPLPCGSIGTATRQLLHRSRATALITDDAAAEADRSYLCRTFQFGELNSGSARGWRPATVDPDGPARIMVSSGSEAEPKMVAYSHNAIAGGRAAYVRALNGGAGPMRNLVLVPLSSSFGSCGVPVTVAALGQTLIVQPSFDPSTTMRVIAEHRPTHVFGVPTMLRRLADQPEPDPPASGLRAIVASGAALPPATAQACHERFGCPVIAVYGSSDGVNCHTATTGLGGGAGVPDPAVASIRILGENGVDTPRGVPGEICARGPMTPMCYLAAPELDARYRLAGGWVRTGDRGMLDSRGRLHVLGRLRQIVIRGGYNISPAEVEEQLAAHPGVAEAVCVGVPDDDLGERLCACVVPRQGATGITLDEVTAFLHRERELERRKLPESLLLLPEFPLGSTGKVCRHTLTVLARTHLMR